jgi:hypothetical protein
MPHTLFESSAITPIQNASGSLVGATYEGTTKGTVLVSNYEYNELIFAGSLGNTGTLFVYALGGGGTTVMGSVIAGSSTGCAIYEVKSDALGSIGTQYNALGALVKVDSGGTWAGAAFWLQRQPRSAGTTPAAAGWAVVGTSLA